MSLPPYAARVRRLLVLTERVDYPPSPDPSTRERAIAAIAQAIATRARKRLYARLVYGTVAAALALAAVLSRVLLVLVAVFLVGCSKPSPPTLTPQKVSVQRIDVTGLALDLAIVATNANSVDLTATGISSHVVVDKTHDVGTVTLPWSDMELLAQLAMSTGAIPYSVDGSLEMGGSLLHVAVPFHLDGTITHAQIVGAMMNSLPVPRSP